MGSRQDPYAVPIEELCLTVRCYNLLKRDGIDTVGQLAVLPRQHLLGLRNFLPRDLDELNRKLRDLGLSPWAAPPPAVPPAGRGTAGKRPGRPGRLWLYALSAVGVLLPAPERDRWVEEWKGELHQLSSRKAKARFTASLLFAGCMNLARTLRDRPPGDKPA